ncbi:MAG: hypothetical protein QM811_18645 [Pirellulales bacterium]
MNDPAASDPIDDIRAAHEDIRRGAGGTPGGTKLFFVGLLLAVVGLYLFLDSVHVTTLPAGWMSGGVNRLFAGGAPTTSTGILFAPIFLGLVLLFYDSRLKAGWILFYLGLTVLVIEILSRIQFFMETKTSHLLLMLGMIAAGVGLMLRSFRETPSSPPKT